jgi:hypothetical protein
MKVPKSEPKIGIPNQVQTCSLFILLLLCHSLMRGNALFKQLYLARQKIEAKSSPGK